jgi:peptidoglycan/LPS O-acetylase OafA/YrhL
VSSGARTALIVVALAAVVWAVPNGGQGADAVSNTLSVVFLAAFVLIGVRLYRETRGRVELLGDAHRLLLYGAIGLIVVALAARPQLVGTGVGTLLFVVLLAMPVLMLYAVWQRFRDVV